MDPKTRADVDTSAWIFIFILEEKNRSIINELEHLGLKKKFVQEKIRSRIFSMSPVHQRDRSGGTFFLEAVLGLSGQIIFVQKHGEGSCVSKNHHHQRHLKLAPPSSSYTFREHLFSSWFFLFIYTCHCCSPLRPDVLHEDCIPRRSLMDVESNATLRSAIVSTRNRSTRNKESNEFQRGCNYWPKRNSSAAEGLILLKTKTTFPHQAPHCDLLLNLKYFTEIVVTNVCKTSLSS